MGIIVFRIFTRKYPVEETHRGAGVGSGKQDGIVRGQLEAEAGKRGFDSDYFKTIETIKLSVN